MDHWGSAFDSFHFNLNHTIVSFSLYVCILWKKCATWTRIKTMNLWLIVELLRPPDNITATFSASYIESAIDCSLANVSPCRHYWEKHCNTGQDSNLRPAYWTDTTERAIKATWYENCYSIGLNYFRWSCHIFKLTGCPHQWLTDCLRRSLCQIHEDARDIWKAEILRLIVACVHNMNGFVINKYLL